MKSEYEKLHKSFSLEILVDDYSFPDPTFDYEFFDSWLSKKGFKPDLVLRESQLIPVCDVVVRSMQNAKLYKENVNYIKSKKYPCSLFIAAWYLLRLGYIKNMIYPEELIVTKLHNILPISFKPFEDKGLEIIKNTVFTGAEKMIEYTYIEGRSLIQRGIQNV